MNQTLIPLPIVPQALDGWSTLHSFFQVDWKSWKKLSSTEQQRILVPALEHLKKIKTPTQGHSSIFSMLGHKSDLMFLHFRPEMCDLNQVQLDFAQLALFDFLTPTYSYVSIVELGMYEMTLKIHEELVALNLKPDSEQWNKIWDDRIQDQYNRMGARVWTDIPTDPYICFYPMSKRRSETFNWYATDFEKRQFLMREHGMIGRKYAGKVTQIISGSIGTDDWEWGVDLFAQNPNVFKKLIYEMRFDEASSRYGEFGPFYIGLQLSIEKFENFMKGKKIT